MESPRCAQCVSCRIGGGVSVTLDLGLGAPSKGALYRAYRGREGDVVAQATNWTSTARHRGVWVILRPPGGLVFRAARGNKKYEVRKLMMTPIWLGGRRALVGGGAGKKRCACENRVMMAYVSLGSVWLPSCCGTGTDAPRRVKAATHEGHPAPWLAGELDPKGAHSEERQGFTSLSEGAVPASFARLLFAPLGSSRGGGARAWQTVS